MADLGFCSVAFKSQAEAKGKEQPGSTGPICDLTQHTVIEGIGSMGDEDKVVNQLMTHADVVRRLRAKRPREGKSGSSRVGCIGIGCVYSVH